MRDPRGLRLTPMLVQSRQAPTDALTFEDTVRGFSAALRRLGRRGPPGRALLFGGAGVIPDRPLNDAILYNAEQVISHGEDFAKRNFAPYAGRIVWDYARSNIAPLRALGVCAVLCPLGYVPEMERIPRGEREDIDVLFYGAMSPRRCAVLDSLVRAGLRVVGVQGVFQGERDRLIARAKVVLNLHFYERPIFEIFRVSHLLANGRCVVSEGGGVDEELEALAERATCLVPYGEIVTACRELVGNPRARSNLAERGREAFRALDLVQHVAQALDETERLIAGTDVAQPPDANDVGLDRAQVDRVN